MYSGITTLETVQARPLFSYKLFTLFYIKHITRGGCGHESSCTLACMVHRRMEGDGRPPPAKQAKLFRYGCQVDGRAASSECRATLRVNNEASADNTTLGSTTSTEAHDRLMSRLNLGVNLAAAWCLQMGPVVVTAVKLVRVAQNPLSTNSVSQLIVTFSVEQPSYV